MVAKRSTLKDEIEAYKRGSDKSRDREEFEGDVGPFLDDVELGDQGSVPTHTAPERRLRRRGDLSIEGNEYIGRSTTRKRAFRQDSQESDEDEDLGAFNLPERSSSSEQSDSGQSDYLESRSDASDSEDHRQENLKARFESSSRKNASEVGTEGWNRLEDDYQKLLEHEASTLSHIKMQERRNKDKARALKNQQQIWENALELRILLQNLVSIGNRAPRPDVYPLLIEQNIEARSSYSGVCKAACSVLDSLCDLRIKLVQNNDALHETVIASGLQNDLLKSGSLEESNYNGKDLSTIYWEKINMLDGMVSSFQDESIDSWHRKTSIATGATVKNMQALNQSVSKQVKDLFRNPSRVMKRAHLPASAVGRVLCQATRIDTSKEAATRSGEEVVSLEEELDMETYDDLDFYQQLLKEFLENASKQGSIAQMNQVRPTKRRKLVDRKASKGRKLRYQVQEPLVNFMAPVERQLPGIASHLFTSLFGLSRPQ